MIAETLALYAKATVRTFEGRENSVGASEIGQCARKVFFAKNAGDRVYGVASDEDWVDTWGPALRGRLIEDHFWVPALRARFGDKLKFAGDEQKTFISDFFPRRLVDRATARRLGTARHQQSWRRQFVHRRM